MNVLILGAAGFIGSNLSKLFSSKGNMVVGIDGLLPGTSGSLENLKNINSNFEFIQRTIQNVENIEILINKSDIIIDSMAWTSHLGAMDNPLYDLELNAKSHLYFLTKIPKDYKGFIIYLGSKGQYGNNKNEIDENSKSDPVDIQGIHKQAGESYYKVFAKNNNLNVTSIRFPNCFGPNQPVMKGDIGLVGNFIRKSLKKNIIEVYGERRERNLIYIDDLSDCINKLILKKITGFHVFNIGGTKIKILKLAKLINKLTKSGKTITQPMPDSLKHIDIKSAGFVQKKIEKLIGPLPITPLDDSLSETIKYFRGKNAVEM